MSETLLLNITALLALLPVWGVSLKHERAKDMVYWLTLVVAVAGVGVWVVAQLAGQWQTGLSITLWVTISMTLLIFLGVSIWASQAWRLTPLLIPYLLILGVMATIWQTAIGSPMSLKVPTGWIHMHIFVSVITYGLVTLAAVAALAAFLQERALKKKQRTRLTQTLPAVVDSESLVLKLLSSGEVVLGIGLLTGVVAQYFNSGQFFVADHKTLLSVGTFLVIGALLIAHNKTGVRGRTAARLVLLAYLLLTLGYPGVKFVTDILIAL